ncbi:histidinol dehydrogenase [Zeaxanthinibacter enoshimensis]|uniref:Histidinol dehydrogenase n=1 Tax=Zeaxanthinibacter enoshimensis TaxID=392009 RepID=A0A4R6TPA4_9FLAO|nr:histidinol dehydrogenase [Zeaxanthinibacter enoshimensis]TDQ31445.1 histidinol dehydrogenase [Zeaxanthinibacter enoshimensis]
MKVIREPGKEQWEEILARPTQRFEQLEDTVREIFKEVQQQGDRAVLKFTAKFDGLELDHMKVPSDVIESRAKDVPDALKQAIELAKSNITKFHKAQISERVSVETSPGVRCWQEKRPIEKVGLYIPGGSAPLFSTVLMLAIPARIAGCKEIILCTPPSRDGEIDPAICYAAKSCGIDKIFKVGGIQAIAAMTFGTETIPAVYKIFGPGNQYVTVAKQWATRYGIAIDMPAGPSELMVVADESADAAFVASDLLSQAEHGPDSQVILVATSESLLSSVAGELKEQLSLLPRKDIAEKAISNSKFIYVTTEEQVAELINAYGPEHLIVCMEAEEFIVNRIINAGSVFLGNYTPESAGDYASGTNHTLPTNGYARQYSGVNLDSFTKSITFQKITADGMETIGSAIEIMAEAEGLQAHKNAVTLRLREIAKNNPESALNN